MTPIRIEAEDMTLTTYLTELASFASSGKFISLFNAAGSIGTASSVFPGSSGRYQVVIRYYDENDGVSQLQVNLGGVHYGWNLSQNLGSDQASRQSLVRRTLATGLSLNRGTTIEIQGTANQQEWSGVDYIKFIPIDYTTYGTKASETMRGDALDNIINGFGGNDTLNGGAGNDILIGGTGNDILNGGIGIDTASYAQATSGIIANLKTGIVTRIAKIMPLGDSITYGKVNDKLENSGGYRTKLWDSFKANGLKVDFVGSESAGPNSLGDKDHEGHPGKTIGWIDDRVNGWLKTSKPDIVLLMIGTNDTNPTKGKSVNQMSKELSGLIDKITQQSPDTQLLVASIPPIRPDVLPLERVQKALDFNAAIPSIVNSKVAKGKKVKFVDMTSLTADDISSPPDDSGLHPTKIGYGKIADSWYEALLDIGINQGTFSVDKDTLRNIENIVGTDFNDTLLGNAGVNQIEGGAGRDTLTGGAGVDTFVYRAPTQGGDKITDFSSNDIFHISASGFGGGLQAGIALSTIASTTGVFVSDANPTAIGTSGNFLYNTSKGVLSFDRDGAGSDRAVEIATLNKVPLLGLDQFTIVA